MRIWALMTVLLLAAPVRAEAAQMHMASFRSHDSSLKLWCEGKKIGALFVNLSKLKYYTGWDRQALDGLMPKLSIKVDDLPAVEVVVSVDLGRTGLTASGESDVRLLTTVGRAQNRVTVNLDLPRGIGLERVFDAQDSVKKVRAMIDDCGLRD